jgi:hypothetical protein
MLCKMGKLLVKLADIRVLFYNDGELIMPLQLLARDDDIVLHVDYRGLTTPEQMAALLHETVSVVRQNAGKTHDDGCVIIDFRDFYFTREFWDDMMAMGREHFVPTRAKVVVLGLSGVRLMLLNAYNHFSGGQVRALRTEAQAITFLTGRPGTLADFQPILLEQYIAKTMR